MYVENGIVYVQINENKVLEIEHQAIIELIQDTTKSLLASKRVHYAKKHKGLSCSVSTNEPLNLLIINSTCSFKQTNINLVDISYNYKLKELVDDFGLNLIQDCWNRIAVLIHINLA